MSALPLHEVLGDFEDAVNLIEDPKDKKEINLVADSIRLGGAILKYYPEMLASQLNGRLLPERQNCRNVRMLLRQCDEVGIHQNALVPAFHCMHTPGGPLKYSMEGHQFAIFSMRLTSDYRYIVSVSNKFITFDVVTSDLTRQVYPAVEGLFLDLQLSADNKFAAAFTNNNETVLLNTLVSEFIVIPNPFPDPERGSKVEGAVQVGIFDEHRRQNSWCICCLMKAIPGSSLARQLSGDLGPPELGGVQHGGPREGPSGVARGSQYPSTPARDCGEGEDRHLVR